MTKMPAAWKKANIQKLEAAIVNANWWDELSDASKEEYVAEHPNSKYAEMHKQAKKKSEDHDDHDSGGHTAPGVLHNAPSTKYSGHPAPYLLKEASKPEMKANSPLRKKVGSFLASRAKNVVSHLKHEAKEFKLAGQACVKLAKRQPLNDHDKHAMAAVASDLAAVAIGIATGGHLAHLLEEGAKALLGHAAEHLALESITKAAVRGAVHHANVRILSSEDIGDFDAILEDAVQIMAKELETADLDKFIDKSEKVEARINMSAEIAGKGLCPECNNPMKIVGTASGKMWTCAADRIALPLPDGHQ
jgi:hypothetical protein